MGMSPLSCINATAQACARMSSPPSWVCIAANQEELLAVGVVQDNDILFAEARYHREKSGLICIHEGFDLVFRDEDIVPFLVGKSGGHIIGRCSHFCGSDSLALAAHVSLLSFLGFREGLGNIFYIDE